jgi:hypothetical protein
LTEPGSPEDLKRHLAWLYPNPQKPCRCEHGYGSMGSLMGMQMGKGWSRTTTHPNCVHHGTKAQQIFKKTGRWPAR